MAEGNKIGGRDVKRLALGFLQAPNFDESSDELPALPPRQLINAFISFFCHNDPKVRRRAIRALGLVTARLASEDRERARVIMRRLMWMLNDESGGIGWGAPEAMGEIMALDAQLAREYGDILVSYLDEQGNFLEFEPLQKGLLQAIARVAETRPEVVERAAGLLPKYLKSDDPTIRGLAARAIGVLKAEAARPMLEALVKDPVRIILFVDEHPIETTVGNLARENLAKLG